jgi:hypothetical protein
LRSTGGFKSLRDPHLALMRRSDQGSTNADCSTETVRSHHGDARLQACLRKVLAPSVAAFPARTLLWLPGGNSSLSSVKNPGEVS